MLILSFFNKTEKPLPIRVKMAARVLKDSLLWRENKEGRFAVEEWLRRRGVVTFSRLYGQFMLKPLQFRIGYAYMETEIIIIPVFHRP